jgi:hypothetical protein
VTAFGLSATPDAARHPALTADLPRGISAGDASSLLVGILLCLQLRFVGQLYLAEIVLALMLPALALRHVRTATRRVPRTFIVLGLVWLYGQIATDIYRGTDTHDLARGWANIVFTLIDFAAVFLLLDGRVKRYKLFALGLATGSLFAYLLDPSSDLGDPWKFGLATPLALVAVLAACSRPVRRVPLLGAVILGAVAAINLERDFRSLALIAALSAIYLAGIDIFSRRQAIRHLHVASFVRLAALGIATIVAFTFLYTHAAQKGWLGHAAAQKYALEAQSPYGIVGGGRPEFRASFHAIIDSPLLGHGSWPKDPRYLKYLVAPGRTLVQLSQQSGLIPTHSYLTGAWVDAGILGIAIWIWAFVLVIRALIRGFAMRDELAPLTAFAAMWLAWAIPFSPYAGIARLFSSFYVLALLFCIERSNSLWRGRSHAAHRP